MACVHPLHASSTARIGTIGATIIGITTIGTATTIGTTTFIIVITLVPSLASDSTLGIPSGPITTGPTTTHPATSPHTVLVCISVFLTFVIRDFFPTLAL